MAIGLVQKQRVAGGTGTTSATASGNGYATNTTGTNLLVLIAWAQSTILSGNAPTIATPTTSGFTWVAGPTATYADGTNGVSGGVSIFYIANAGAMSSSTSTSVTATRSLASATAVDFACYEFSGVVTTSPVDTSALNSNQTSTPTDGGTLVTSKTDLIIAAFEGEDSVALGTGFSLGIASTSTQYGGSMYNLNKASGSIDTAWGSGNTGLKWGACSIAFLPYIPPSVTRSQASTFGF